MQDKYAGYDEWLAREEYLNQRIKVLWKDGCVDEMSIARLQELEQYKDLRKHIVHTEPINQEPNDSQVLDDRLLTYGHY